MEARITRGIEQIAGKFELALAERWPGQAERAPLRPGQPCRLEVDGETLITGHLDAVEPRYSSREHRIAVSGRDATGDLVDCSAVHEPGEWKGQTALQIAQAICQPFGIKVQADVTVGAPFSSFRAEAGETVFEALERLARMRGVLLISDGRGGLVITRAGQLRVRTVLERGVNILAGEAEYSHLERYSRYVVKAQARENDNYFGASAQQAKGEASDLAIKRHRPLLILAEEGEDGARFQERAEWERAVRYGRSARLQVTVQGWSHDEGLWSPNRRVHVKDDWLGVDQELLIVRVTLIRDEGGTRTELALYRPEAFERIALPETQGKELWWPVLPII
jgi:prophage tail gpP-like protein